MNTNTHRDNINNTGTAQRTAVVIGGGISGIITSRVLANHFDRVLLLERDKYPYLPEFRDGTPQSRHVHILLLKGRQILEELFPGLGKELIKRGATTVEMGSDLAVLSYYGWRVKYPGGLRLLIFALPLLEWCLRQRLKKIAQIRFIEECRVTGLNVDKQANRVNGVRCQLSDVTSAEQNIYSEFVVDASGRFSHAPSWLFDIGYDPPEESVVNPFLGYASRLYEIPDRFRAVNTVSRTRWRALLLQGKPPDLMRGGVLLPVEGNRWHVTLAGVGKD